MNKLSGALFVSRGARSASVFLLRQVFFYGFAVTFGLRWDRTLAGGDIGATLFLLSQILLDGVAIAFGLRWDGTFVRGKIGIALGTLGFRWIAHTL